MRKIQLSISAIFISFLISCTQTEAPKIEWKFSDKDELVYSYAQNSTATQSIGEQKKVNEYLLQADLVLMIQENGNADLELRNVTSSMWFPGTTDTVKNLANDNVIAKGLQINGKPENPSDRGSDLFEFLFVIPDSLLQAGESIIRPTKFPFNATDGIYFVHGQQKITLKEYKEIDGQKFAVIQTEITANDLKVPNELKKQYACDVKGSTEFTFNLDERYFTKGIIDLNIDVTNHQFDTNKKITTLTSSSVHYEILLKEVLTKPLK